MKIRRHDFGFSTVLFEVKDTSIIEIDEQGFMHIVYPQENGDATLECWYPDPSDHTYAPSYLLGLSRDCHSWEQLKCAFEVVMRSGVIVQRTELEDEKRKFKFHSRQENFLSRG